MNAMIEYVIDGHQLVLSPERVMYWPEEKTIIVSDMHLGKTGHFRKAGIPVPSKIYMADLHRLVSTIMFFKAEKLLIVGDLTHSSSNLELELFTKWRKDLSALEMVLVKGNHDILQDTWYDDAKIDVVGPIHYVQDFAFMHDVKDCKEPIPQYIFAGHIHPGIAVRGGGKQTLKFPCFYFADDYALLPAFGGFTGVSLVKPTATDNIFAIVDKTIMQIQ